MHGMIGKHKILIKSISWNLFLISAGAVIFGFGLKSIILPHGFITGGLSGVSLLVYYWTTMLSPGVWYFILNLPIFVAGWLFVSRRFLFYSIYGMVVLSLSMDLISLQIPIMDPFLVILAGGCVAGAGAGITLHSLGSLGGNDIIAIILNQKFGLRIGTFFFIFNLVLFAFSFGVLDVELVLYSLALSFVISQVLDYVLTMFNQRKMVLIISDKYRTIGETIQAKLRRGATYLEGTGGYTGRSKKVILTVVNNYQLKRLEESVFTIDPEAFLITENTFNVLGKGFSRRKVY